MLPAFQTECTVCAVCNYRASNNLCLTKMPHLLQSSDTIPGRQIFPGLQRWLQMAFDGECACLCVCARCSEGEARRTCTFRWVTLTYFNFLLAGKYCRAPAIWRAWFTRRWFRKCVLRWGEKGFRKTGRSRASRDAPSSTNPGVHENNISFISF